MIEYSKINCGSQPVEDICEFTLHESNMNL